MGSIGQKLIVGITSKRAAVWTTFGVRQFIFDECVVVACVLCAEGVEHVADAGSVFWIIQPLALCGWMSFCASASDIVIISGCADASLIALQCSVQVMMDYPFEGNFKTLAKFVGSLKAAGLEKFPRVVQKEVYAAHLTANWCFIRGFVHSCRSWKIVADECYWWRMLVLHSWLTPSKNIYYTPSK